MAWGWGWGEGWGFPEHTGACDRDPRMTGGEEEGMRPLAGQERRSRPWRVAGRPRLWHSHEWAGRLGEERTGGAPEDEDRAAERFSPDGLIRLTDGSGAAANGAVTAQPASDG